MLNPILLAVPLFLAGIFIEWFISHKRGLKLYRWNDTLTNLHLGTGQVLCSVLIKSPLLALYLWSWQSTQNWHLITWQKESIWHWIIGILLMDCAYYFFHRASHEVNFLWAAHAVHHQSESYNLSVALRQSWIQQIYSGIFYIPLAVLGIPLPMFFILNATNTVYQFWIHTRLCDRIGFWESFLNTPSHHRVHHGVDDDYVDKNYAGVFIIWDKVFGTFTPETTQPRYGVIKPLRSWNPLWANLDPWVFMWRRITQAKLTWSETLSLIFRKPNWVGRQEEKITMHLRTDESYQLYDQHNTWIIYVIISSVIAIQSATWWVVGFGSTLSWLYISPWIISHLASGVTLAALLEERPWAKMTESIRLLTFPLLAYFLPLSDSSSPTFIWGNYRLWYLEIALFTVIAIVSFGFMVYQSSRSST